MKYLLLAIIILICVSICLSQNVVKNYGRIDVEITKQKNPKKIITKVKIINDFPGGDSAWVQLMENELHQTLRLNKKIKKGKYLVPVSFVILQDSTIADIKCLNNPGWGMCQEVMGILLKRFKGEKWAPGPTPVRPYIDQH